jgi:hypothetical protein
MYRATPTLELRFTMLDAMSNKRETSEHIKKTFLTTSARGAPSVGARYLAQRLIAAIEEREATHAEEFALDRTLKIVREIAALERELGPDVSDDEAKRGSSSIRFAVTENLTAKRTMRHASRFAP